MRIQTILAMLIAGTMCQFTTGLTRAQDAGSASPAKVKGPIPIIQEKIRGEVAARLAGGRARPGGRRPARKTQRKSRGQGAPRMGGGGRRFCPLQVTVAADLLLDY